MDLALATPGAALLGLAVLLPLAVTAAATVRVRRVRRVLGLPAPKRRGYLVPAAASAGAAALLALAAAQPVLTRHERQLVRTDAEAYVVLDVTRSMLAQANPSARARLERAKEAALTIRAALPGVPVGIASMTDRVLPHVFPTPDEDVFRATIERSIGIEHPPPQSGFGTNVTSIGSLDALSQLGFFSPAAAKRLAVVVTDGESQPSDPTRLAALLQGPPRIETVFVHVWGANERVFRRGAPEPQYEPDPSSRSALQRLAAATGGSVFAEERAGQAAARARDVLGSGRVVSRAEARAYVGLAPYLALGALLPLGVALLRRER